MKAFIMGIVVLGLGVADAGIEPNIKKGDRAPDFYSSPVNGGASVTLAAVLKEKRAVFLNIFNSWCPPCHDEAPGMVKVYKEYREKGVEFISVCRNKRDAPRQALAFAKRYGFTWPMVFDQMGFIATDYRVNGVPTNVVILPDGTVSFASFMLTEEGLRAALDEALAEKSSPQDKK